MKNNGVVVGLGEVLWDMFPEGKKLGGAPANFAYHVSQFGFESYAVSAIGDDELGAEILDQLKDKSLNICFPKVGFETGTVIVELDERGVPSYEIKMGVAWDNLPYTPEIKAIAESTKCVCFGSLAQRNEVSRNTIMSFLKAVPADSLRVFDINLRQHYYSREVIEESLAVSNVFKVNDDELEIITDLLSLKESGINERCRELLERYDLEILILTCGTDGSYVFTESDSSFHKTPIVEVADTVGAGDSFTATFCASVMLGRTIQEAHKKAVEISAYVCTQSGAMPDLKGVI